MWYIKKEYQRSFKTIPLRNFTAGKSYITYLGEVKSAKVNSLLNYRVVLKTNYQKVKKIQIYFCKFPNLQRATEILLYGDTAIIHADGAVPLFVQFIFS